MRILEERIVDDHIYQVIVKKIQGQDKRSIISMVLFGTFPLKRCAFSLLHASSRSSLVGKLSRTFSSVSFEGGKVGLVPGNLFTIFSPQSSSNVFHLDPITPCSMASLGATLRNR